MRLASATATSRPDDWTRVPMIAADGDDLPADWRPLRRYRAAIGLKLTRRGVTTSPSSSLARRA